jgi:hypothetical protein
LKIGFVPTSAPMIRGSQAMRASPSIAAVAAIQRSIGSGRFSAIQAMPGAISASPTVSQPVSSAKVRVSASAAADPAACSAAADATPGRAGRPVNCSAATANQAASSKARPAKGSERSRPAMR